MKPGEMMELLAELQRYREREPLVQGLLQLLHEHMVLPDWWSDTVKTSRTRSAMQALRDFKVTP